MNKLIERLSRRAQELTSWTLIQNLFSFSIVGNTIILDHSLYYFVLIW